jgi:5'(3')-deoxyribonucleotidase
MMSKKIVFVDMDNVLVDFQSGIDQVPEETRLKYHGRMDEVPHIFSLMKPIEHAIESYQILSVHFDTYILSTAPWENATAWHDKNIWVRKYLGTEAYKRLILSHHKHLNSGDYLIDDRNLHNGADKFTGELIHFGSDRFPDWKSVMSYLLP